jgi:hypothetical protein
MSGGSNEMSGGSKYPGKNPRRGLGRSTGMVSPFFLWFEGLGQSTGMVSPFFLFAYCIEGHVLAMYANVRIADRIPNAEIGTTAISALLVPDVRLSHLPRFGRVLLVVPLPMKDLVSLLRCIVFFASVGL